MTKTLTGIAEAITCSNMSFQRTILSPYTETDGTDNVGKGSLVKKQTDFWL